MEAISGDLKEQKWSEKMFWMLWPSFCFVVISAQAMKDLCALSIAVAVSAQL